MLLFSFPARQSMCIFFSCTDLISKKQSFSFRPVFIDTPIALQVVLHLYTLWLFPQQYFTKKISQIFIIIWLGHSWKRSKLEAQRNFLVPSAQWKCSSSVPNLIVSSGNNMPQVSFIASQLLNKLIELFLNYSLYIISTFHLKLELQPNARSLSI